MYGAVVLVISSFFLLFGSGQAAPLLQATETPTPTVTAAPFNLIETATPMPTFESLQCPEGTPQGYGTVTPGPLWNMMCSQCSVSQGPTATIDLTATATPTPTATATGTTVPDHYYQGPGWDNVWHTRHTYGWYQQSTVFPISLIDPIWGYVYQGENRYYSGNNPGLYLKPMQAPSNSLHGNTSHHVYYTAFFKACMAQADNDVDMNAIFDAAGVTGCTHKFRLPLNSWYEGDTGQTKNILWMYEWGHDGELWIDYFTPIYYGAGIVEPTPTPTATSTPISSYCAQVEEGVQLYDFGWGGLQYGTETCLDIGPYYIELFGVPLGIPEIGHICFLPVSIGIMYLFGVAISIDAFLLILTGIAVLRLVTR